MNPTQMQFFLTGVSLQKQFPISCASASLASVVHELDRAPLSKAMNLRSDQHIVAAQAVGCSM
jgi:hypothetical protein